MSTTLKKTLAGVAVLGFLALGFVTPAKADTLSDLTAQLAALQAQIAALTGGSSCNAGTYNHTVTLKQGSMGSQVMAMQKVIGAIPDGNFGPATKAKVATFQSSKGLVTDGVVGPATGAALHTASMVNCDGDTDTDTDNNNGDLEGDNGSIQDINTLSQYSSEEVGDGEEEVTVAGVEIEVSNDGDIMLRSAKVVFDPSGNNAADSDNLDDYIESVSLWLDGE